ncbi:MAG: sigma-E processing peptidase SpoIIGA [Anaerotignum sp.]
MEPTIYIDVLFFVVWGMDAFLLWAAGRIAGFRGKNWRILLGGLLSAALYCGWVCLFRKNGGLLLSLVLLAVGTAVAYFPKRLGNFLRLLGGGLLASFLMGGGVNVLFTMTQAQRVFGQGIVLQKAYPWWLLPWSVIMAYLLLKLGARWMESHIRRRREFCTITVLWRGKQAEGRTLIDTGNGLRQPDGRGVAVLEMAALLSLFSPEESVRILSGRMEGLGLEFIPFTSLGNPDGKLWGIRAEQLILSFGEKSILHKNIFLGISMETFTGSYEGLVPPCLLEEELG